MEIEVEILTHDCIKKINIEPVRHASETDLLWLAELQHIDFRTQIKFKASNECHQRYLERGLLFTNEVDAILFAKSGLLRSKAK